MLDSLSPATASAAALSGGMSPAEPERDFDVKANADHHRITNILNPQA